MTRPLPQIPRETLERFWRGDPGEEPIPERDILDFDKPRPKPGTAEYHRMKRAEWGEAYRAYQRAWKREAYRRRKA